MFYGAAFTLERALWKAGQSGRAGGKATLATWRFRMSLNVWSSLLIRLMVEGTALTQRGHAPVERLRDPAPGGAPAYAPAHLAHSSKTSLDGSSRSLCLHLDTTSSGISGRGAGEPFRQHKPIATVSGFINDQLKTESHHEVCEMTGQGTPFAPTSLAFQSAVCQLPLPTIPL